MDDFCQDADDLFGKRRRCEMAEKAHKISTSLGTELKKRLDFKVYKYSHKHKWIRKYSCIRHWLVPVAKIVRKQVRATKDWWFLATSPNKSVMAMKVPGRFLMGIIGRCQEKKKRSLDYSDQFKWVYKFVKDDLERHYPDIHKMFTWDLDEKIATEDDYIHYVKDVVLPTLKEELKRIRKNQFCDI